MVALVKLILAKKRNMGGFLYLVQKVGEPDDNAEWLTGSQLPPKAQEGRYPFLFGDDCIANVIISFQ